MKTENIQIFDHDTNVDVTHKINTMELDNWINHLKYIKKELSNLINICKNELKDKLDDKSVVERFEKKEIEAQELEIDIDAEVDPMNTPISELLKSRADERRKKMKNFNHKFNSSKIEDIEKIPAYKRQGLELEDRQHSSDNNISRTSLGVDENDDIQLRSNNSFLHDNVD